ncbi:MAG TPA: hypothetical protein VM659_06950 [Dongiaceae bacterium]|nr:hypothetical protein [Dongiaceae bacterium]
MGNRVTRGCRFRRRIGHIAAASLAASVIGAPVAKAESCKQIAGISAAVDRFIDKVYALQLSGRGTLPVTDALFGFQHIDAKSLGELDQRQPIEVTRQDQEDGTFVNRGPAPMTLTGKFAQSETFFAIPAMIRGNYVSTPDSLTLTYDPAHAVKVGQSFLGMKFSHTINHTVITRHSLAYFFDENSSDEPDRCYVLVNSAEIAANDPPRDANPDIRDR